MNFFGFKGSIFSKLNIVDIFALLLLIFLLPAFYYSFHMYKIYKQEMGTEKKTGRVSSRDFFVIFPNVPESHLPLIREEDQMLDKVGLSKMQLIKIHRTRKTERGNQLYATMKLSIKEDKDGVFYGEDKIVHKLPFVFITTKYTLDGMILQMQPPNYGDTSSSKWVVFKCKVQFSELSEGLVNTILQGDEEIKPDGEKMAELIEIISKESNLPKKLEVLTGRDVYLNYDPSYFPKTGGSYDVSAWILFKGKIEGDRASYKLHFKRSPIMIDGLVSFSTLNYTITGKILSILPYDKEDLL